MHNQPYNPLHGITLKTLLTDLVEHFGFAHLAKHVRIKCFTNDPSINSSLKFLRKTEWARKEVEEFYIANKHQLPKQ